MNILAMLTFYESTTNICIWAHLKKEVNNTCPLHCWIF